MSQCSPFNIPFQGSAQDLLEKAKKAIQDDKGSITIDGDGGTFIIPTPLGKIEGKFLIEGQNITITITKKPFALPTCQQIEDELKKLLSN